MDFLKNIGFFKFQIYDMGGNGVTNRKIDKNEFILIYKALGYPEWCHNNCIALL